MKVRCSREFGEEGSARIPDFDGVDVRVDDILQVSCQRGAIDLGTGSWLANSLSDVEDDAGEAVLVDVDFLVVGDLPELAVGGGLAGRSSSYRQVCALLGTRLGWSWART